MVLGMKTNFPLRASGYTVVELMVTIVIVTVLAASVGAFMVKLLTLQEREREEAYVREKLSDICGAYADFISIGSSILVDTSPSNLQMVVKYRLETGGVSLETGVVTRVAYLTSTMNATNRTMNVDVWGLEPEGATCKLSRTMNGNAALIPLVGDMVSCTLTPLNANVSEDDGVQTSDAVLAYLQVSARFEAENPGVEPLVKTATVGRVVRLWNRE